MLYQIRPLRFLAWRLKVGVQMQRRLTIQKHNGSDDRNQTILLSSCQKTKTKEDRSGRMQLAVNQSKPTLIFIHGISN